MTERDWNTHYADGFLPWDAGAQSAHLEAFVAQWGQTSARVLEIGCGTGNDAVWLAAQGFDVLGIDGAPLAIEQARAKAEAAGVECRFEVRDLFRGDLGGPYDLVYDRGCFHTFDSHDRRLEFAGRVAEVLAPDGRWLSLIGSTEGGPREGGPPRRSARDVTAAVEPALEILALSASAFQLEALDAPQAWICISRPRRVPAEPSTGSR